MSPLKNEGTFATELKNIDIQIKSAYKKHLTKKCEMIFNTSRHFKMPCITKSTNLFVTAYVPKW